MTAPPQPPPARRRSHRPARAGRPRRLHRRRRQRRRRPAASVVAAFYPLQFVAERVGGDDGPRRPTSSSPAPSRTTWSSTPGQVGQISDADLVLYLSGFQPAVDEAVAAGGRRPRLRRRHRVPLLDAAAGGHDHTRARRSTATSTSTSRPGPARLARPDPARHHRRPGRRPARRRADPAHAADYTARAAALRADLDDARRASTRAGLATCQRREIVVSHTAFGYLPTATGWSRSASAASPRRPSRRRSGWPRSTEEARDARRHHDLLRERWSARRSPRPSPARSARRPRCSTRWRAAARRGRLPFA